MGVYTSLITAMRASVDEAITLAKASDYTEGLDDLVGGLTRLGDILLDIDQLTSDSDTLPEDKNEQLREEVEFLVSIPTSVALVIGITALVPVASTAGIVLATATGAAIAGVAVGLVVDEALDYFAEAGITFVGKNQDFSSISGDIEIIGTTASDIFRTSIDGANKVYAGAGSADEVRYSVFENIDISFSDDGDEPRIIVQKTSTDGIVKTDELFKVEIVSGTDQADSLNFDGYRSYSSSQPQTYFDLKDGDDVVILADSIGVVKTFNGGAGIDTLQFQGDDLELRAWINAATGEARVGTDSIFMGPGQYSFTGIERYYGTNDRTTFVSGAGDEFFDGLDGEDKIIFSGSCFDYDISKAEDGTITISHVRGSRLDGTDTVVNVENAVFGDGVELDLTQEEVYGCTLFEIPSSILVANGSDMEGDQNFARQSWLRSGDVSYDVIYQSSYLVIRGEGSDYDFTRTLDAFDTVIEDRGIGFYDFRSDDEFIYSPEEVVDFFYSISDDDPRKQSIFFSVNGQAPTQDATIRHIFDHPFYDNGPEGGTFGDPHLVTFDGVSYDFQGEGEFYLARSISSPDYEIQARFTSVSPSASVIDAVATYVGSSVVTIEAAPDGGQILVDGELVVVEAGSRLQVGPGSITRSGDIIRIDNGERDFLSVGVYSSFLNVFPEPSASQHYASLQGLLGNFDGDPSNDLQLLNGTNLDFPVDTNLLYGDFASDWQVSEADRILPGIRKEFRAPEEIVTLETLPPDLLQSAEEAVDAAGIFDPVLRNAAILDFAITGNFDFIDAAVDAQRFVSPLADADPEGPTPRPTVYIASSTRELSEESAEENTVEITVGRSDSKGDLEVSYFVSGDVASSDFAGGGLTGIITLADGERTGTFSLVVFDDDQNEGLENFNIEISIGDQGQKKYDLGVSTVQLSIDDDDAPPPINEIDGTDGRDNLVGTEGDDAIRSFAGSYDKMSGDGGADQFIFGDEAMNGVRERDVILDYEVGIDSIVLEGAAAVGSIRETSSSVVIFLEGDRDAIYVRGDGVAADNLTIVTDDVLELV